MVDIKKLVRFVLERHPESKDSDMRLFGWCCSIMRPEVMKLSFGEVMWRHKELDLPSFDTIQRTRQQLQHDHPELRGKAYNARMKKQEEYREKFGRNHHE